MAASGVVGSPHERANIARNHVDSARRSQKFQSDPDPKFGIKRVQRGRRTPTTLGGL